MKSMPVFVVLVLWMIAILATLLIVKDSGAFTFLGPIQFICMLGCVVTVRNAMSRPRG